MNLQQCPIDLDKGDLIVLYYGSIRLYYGDNSYICFDTKNDYSWTRIGVSDDELFRAFIFQYSSNEKSIIIK